MGSQGDNEFRCISSGKGKASFLLVSTEDTKEVYPFDFELVITYILKEEGIQVIWEVKNPAYETMYFTIGGHPASGSRRKMRRNQTIFCGSPEKRP